ncbi:MAG: hypothetical protein IJD85_03050 [Oscillospiraceae bacterium]|nr:hypothetical protein [Oscillospiraceae bacterium]
MNFREKYKNSIEIMSPSAEQLERMKKNILEQAKAPEKKAIPFKKIAYIGSAVAACAVISVAAINIVPRLSGGSADLTATESCSDTAGAAVGGNAFEEGASENFATNADVDFAPEYVVADGAIADYDYDMELGTKSDDASFNDSVNTPNFEPVGELNAAEESADDACCDDVVADEAEMTDAATSAPTTTTAVNIDSCTDTPTEEMTASDDAVQDVVQDIETESSIYIADDLSYIDIGNEFFVGLGNEADLPEKVVDLPVTNISYTSPEGTEYRLEFHGDGIIMLFRGNEVIGMYTRLTLD